MLLELLSQAEKATGAERQDLLKRAIDQLAQPGALESLERAATHVASSSLARVYFALLIGSSLEVSRVAEIVLGHEAYINTRTRELLAGCLLTPATRARLWELSVMLYDYPRERWADFGRHLMIELAQSDEDWTLVIDTLLECESTLRKNVIKHLWERAARRPELSRFAKGLLECAVRAIDPQVISHPGPHVARMHWILECAMNSKDRGLSLTPLIFEFFAGVRSIPGPIRVELHNLAHIHGEPRLLRLLPPRLPLGMGPRAIAAAAV